jgi:hypothetical protein
MNKQAIATGLLSLLTLTSPTKLKADWDNVLVGGAAVGILASAGGLLYWALKPEAPEEIKRKAEVYFANIIPKNQALVTEYQAIENPDSSIENLVLLVRTKGQNHHNIHTLVYGRTALLEESKVLMKHHQKLISSFGSEEAARRAYFNFDNLVTFAAQLKAIARLVETHVSFQAEHDAYVRHQEQMREISRMRNQLNLMQMQQMELNRAMKKSQETLIQPKPKVAMQPVEKQKPQPTAASQTIAPQKPTSSQNDSANLEKINARIYKYLGESL